MAKHTAVVDPIQIIEDFERHNSVAWIRKFVPIYLFHFVFSRLA